MGDIDILNVNVSHFKADNIFVRTLLLTTDFLMTIANEKISFEVKFVQSNF